MKYPIQTNQKNVVLVPGSFAPFDDGTGADPTAVKGAGYGVVYTADGRWTVTLSDSMVECISFTATIQLASAAARNAQVTKTSDKIWIIRNLDAAGAEAAIDAAAGNRVNFLAVIRK